MTRKRCSAAAGIPDFPGTEGGTGPMDLERTMEDGVLPGQMVLEGMEEETL